MMRQMWRRLFAAAVGAFALAGSAAAQNPVTIPQASTVTAQPAMSPTVPSVPAAAAGAPVAPSKGAVVIQGDGGCAGGGCGSAHPVATAARGFVMNSTGGYVGTDCQFGRGCNNGCGSLKSDLGFFFGSCNSFFAPCGPGTLGCHKCLTPVYGRGSCGPYNPCVYDSFMNH